MLTCHVIYKASATWPDLKDTAQFERAASAIMGGRPAARLAVVVVAAIAVIAASATVTKAAAAAMDRAAVAVAVAETTTTIGILETLILALRLSIIIPVEWSLSNQDLVEDGDKLTSIEF
ncbi:unnamed protein product [Danaus chrysippus]|uniref:(African queen) hypothetical protein n=1 Tax=Danaus chrysippus TaxID=151541 RepID=A0A8J2R2N4_9NEOP|nr:unnamed protein product [Danaus chrysippus]